MARRSHTFPSAAGWQQAAGLIPCAKSLEGGCQGAFVPDPEQGSDHIAVVYDSRDTPPKITIHEVSGSVHTVCANGIAVAIVGCATGPAPQADEVLLVERMS